jgi:transcriptional regulator with XRE-family HTH domain
MAQTQVGSTIATLRDVRGLTQVDLAAKAGIDRSHLAKIETGVVTPGLITLAKIARALRVKSSQLIRPE